jgi:ethanolamine transporter EutH
LNNLSQTYQSENWDMVKDLSRRKLMLTSLAVSSAAALGSRTALAAEPAHGPSGSGLTAD